MKKKVGRPAKPSCSTPDKGSLGREGRAVPAGAVACAPPRKRRRPYRPLSRAGQTRVNGNAALRKLAVINVLSNGEGTCRHCGHGDIDVLCLDHVNDDGAMHRGSSKTNKLCGSKLYSWLIRTGYEAGKAFQVLCANCNLKKEVLRQRAKWA